MRALIRRPLLALLLPLLAASPTLAAGGTGTTDPGWADAVRNRLLHEALTQAERPRSDWDRGQRDCAGLVRLLFRKAAGAGAAIWTGKDGRPAPFLTAEELVAYNFAPVSRTPVPDHVETGDLLAYFDETEPPGSAWHLVVLLRPPGAVPDRILAVYHNGATGNDAAVRKVWLDDLETGPPEWRPAPGNPRFLGTFRWNGFPAEGPAIHPASKDVRHDTQ